MKNNKFLPTSEPVLDGKEKEYVIACFQRNWISAGGKFTEKFEQQFAEYVGVQYAVTCSNGTAAVHLALAALGVGPGDEVIIPDFTIIVSASMTILSGAKPVLVDVDKYWCIDTDLIEEKITSKTKAIMPVHMYGNPANMKAILAIARKHRLYVIEDACAAHGATVGKKKVGSMGEIGCFSFYASKNITSGEGGMVVTNDKRIADQVRLLKSHAFERPRFIHRYLGFNYRMTDIQSAVGLAQLENIEKKVSRRREIAGYYSKLLEGVKEVTTHPNPPWGESVFWMYSILINDSFGRSREDIMEQLAKQSIGSERFFLPMSQQPIFLKGGDPRYPNVKGSYPVSHAIGKQGMYLPSGLTIKKKDQECVITALLALRK